MGLGGGVASVGRDFLVKPKKLDLKQNQFRKYERQLGYERY